MISLLYHIAMPLIHNIIHIIDSRYKGFNELFLAAQFRTGVNCLVDGYQYFFILTMGIMILLHKHQNIINIDFYLTNQFNLKYHIICNIRTFLPLVFPLVAQILITTKIILQITLSNQFFLFKFIK